MFPTYPVSNEERAKLSKLLVNELIGTKDLSYIESILTESEMVRVEILDYSESPKARPEILQRIVENTSTQSILKAVVFNNNVMVETLDYVCSNYECNGVWTYVLDAPKATKNHAKMITNLVVDKLCIAAVNVAESKFLDEEIADKLFERYSLVDFNFYSLKKISQSKKDDYYLKRYIILRLLENELVPKKWLEIYAPIIKNIKANG